DSGTARNRRRTRLVHDARDVRRGEHRLRLRPHAEEERRIGSMAATLIIGADAGGNVAPAVGALFHMVGAFMLNAVRPPLSVVSVMLGLPSARLWAAARARILPTDRELDPAGEGASSIDSARR